MPFTPGDPTLQPMSASWNTDPVNSTSSDSITIATPGAATWPPSAASSSVASLMDSSAAAPITEITLVSSPPTSHAASPSRTISSPLRPSSAANMPGSPLMAREMAKAAASTHAAAASVAHMDQVVSNSNTEDGANTPQRSPSQARQSASSIHLSDQHTPADGSSVYVHIPITSPSSTTLPQESSSTKKKTKKQGESPRRRSSAGSDSAHASPATLAADAAYAAALAAQEETLARRRPTRNARKEVSYSPMCDSEGKLLPGKKHMTASASYSKSKAAAKEGAANKTKAKRRSRAFSDDQDEENDVGNSKSTANQVIDVDVDVTDDDVGFASRRERKKAKVDSEGEGEKQTKSTKLPNKRQRVAIDDDAEEDALSEHDHKNDDNQGAILTPPAPTSPRRSSRRSLPSPKKQIANDKVTNKGKGKQHKTFDLEQEAAAEEDEDEQPRATSTGKAAKRNKSPSSEAQEESDEEAAEEQTENAEKPSRVSEGPKPASADSRPSCWSSTFTSTTTNPSAAASVAMKGINTSSPAPASPLTCSPNARSFFGKPLSKLLNFGAVRRPGLTRKTKIPSLLNHRGAPKAPALQLVASKRRMQDDDYEYDPDYEALVAKNKPQGSDEESDDKRGVEHHDGAEGEGKIVEEYD
ncbi:hypothetical protein NDA18_003502 [Ustilago nuda]|nr:hypothetical protein NDA18_003502 [Ustilago nuda]